MFSGIAFVDASCSGFDTGGHACEVCISDRVYVGERFDSWDFFRRTGGSSPEIVFSYIYSNAILQNVGGNIDTNFQVSTDTKPSSNFIPPGVNEILIFNVRGLRFTTHPANRNDIAGRIVYDLRYSIPSFGENNVSGFGEFRYWRASESTLSDGRTLLTILNNGQPYTFF